MEACAVAYAGGDGDDGGRDHAAYDTGECSFHSGDDDDDAHLLEAFAGGEEAMDAGDADVVIGFDALIHDFEGFACFLGDGQVAGSGADQAYGCGGELGLFLPQGNTSGGLVEPGLGEVGFDGEVFFFIGASGEDIAAVLSEAFEDFDRLVGGFSGAEDDFGEATAQGSVMIDFGEA